MAAVVSPLPDNDGALKALLTAALARADEAEARAANAVARESAIEAVIAHLKLQIAKLRREQYGPSAERTPGASSSSSPTLRAPPARRATASISQGYLQG